jgi:3-methylcrotonyl-CoA carboxylase alpha subunit
MDARHMSAPRVAIANRAEIAIRIAATCRLRGLQPVLITTDAEPESYAARVIGQIAHAGVAGAELDPDAVVAAARQAGCTYLHPGYGFLSERPSLARACASTGITFVGPSAETLELCGDKVATRAIAEASGVPLLAATPTLGDDPDEWTRAAADIGYPILVKAVQGGGGASLRQVANTGELVDAIASARREAEAAGAGPLLYLERFLSGARHIEVQVAGDGTHAVALGERECSLQRRHQKVIEEAPATRLPESDRQRLYRYAVTIAEAVKLKNLATVEFLYAPDGTIAFIEVNPRLQVEHPVTEVTSGLDLVALQLDLANGASLPSSAPPHGHAIEARLYAEDPANLFLPSPGRISVLALPSAPGVRIDAGYQAHDRVPDRFDPMIAKLIAWGQTREQAVARLRDTLEQSAIAGVATNRSWLLALLDDARVRDGNYDTQTAVAIPAPSAEGDRPDLIQAALIAQTLERPPSNDPWERIGPFRMSGATELAFHDPNDGWEIVASVERSGAGWQLSLGDTTVPLAWQRGDDGVWTITLGPQSARFAIAGAPGDTIEVSGAAGRWFARAGRRPLASNSRARATDNAIRAPLPGKVIRVEAAPDQLVAEGAPLIILSAMKIEIVLRAPRDCRVREVHCHPEDQVDAGALLVELIPEEDA